MNEAQLHPEDLAPPLATLSGELRGALYSSIVRVIRALTFVTLFRSLAAFMARYLLAYRRFCTLEMRQGQLCLNIDHKAFGRTIRTSQELIALNHLVELRFEERGDSPRLYAGLASLCVGTTCGTWLLADGMMSGAPSLLIWGSVLVLMGITGDFLLGSGRTPPTFTGQAQLAVQGSKRGFVISGIDQKGARLFLNQVTNQLGLPISEPSAHPSPSP